MREPIRPILVVFSTFINPLILPPLAVCSSQTMHLNRLIDSLDGVPLSLAMSLRTLRLLDPCMVVVVCTTCGGPPAGMSTPHCHQTKSSDRTCPRRKAIGAVKGELCMLYCNRMHFSSSSCFFILHKEEAYLREARGAKKDIMYCYRSGE